MPLQGQIYSESSNAELVSNWRIPDCNLDVKERKGAHVLAMHNKAGTQIQPCSEEADLSIPQAWMRQKRKGKHSNL
eukprot:scaffold216342_cov18-Tisochrysis_lutea.AAC.4